MAEFSISRLYIVVAIFLGCILGVIGMINNASITDRATRERGSSFIPNDPGDRTFIDFQSRYNQTVEFVSEIDVLENKLLADGELSFSDTVTLLFKKGFTVMMLVPRTVTLTNSLIGGLVLTLSFIPSWVPLLLGSLVAVLISIAVLSAIINRDL